MEKLEIETPMVTMTGVSGEEERTGKVDSWCLVILGQQ